TGTGRGETVFYRGTVLTPRETGVLAALGIDRVSVVRKPVVGIISTGDEIRAPGESLPAGCVYDSNATVLADAVWELGGEPRHFGIVPDDFEKLNETFGAALAACDAVLLSGGTSKGAGDISYRVVGEFGPPGVVAHGVALKPGKPLCLAVISHAGRRPVPVAVLPGFPTSAVFTFHEFVAPVLRLMAGRPPEAAGTGTSTLPMRVRPVCVRAGSAESPPVPRLSPPSRWGRAPGRSPRSGGPTGSSPCPGRASTWRPARRSRCGCSGPACGLPTWS